MSPIGASARNDFEGRPGRAGCPECGRPRARGESLGRGWDLPILGTATSRRPAPQSPVKGLSQGSAPAGVPSGLAIARVGQLTPNVAEVWRSESRSTFSASTDNFEPSEN
jgi:hypothetical protein